jgi:hypothetical protein
MKIYPELTKLWANKIREAGMTKNRAKKVIEESAKTQKAANEFLETPNRNTETNSQLTNLLKKINIF